MAGAADGVLQTGSGPAITALSAATLPAVTAGSICKVVAGRSVSVADYPRGIGPKLLSALLRVDEATMVNGVAGRKRVFRS